MADNYYSAENDRFMSNSQLKVWLECQNRAHAQFISHKYKPRTSKAMALGSLLDALLTDPEREQSVLNEYREHLLGVAGQLLAGTRDVYEQAAAVKANKLIWGFVQSFQKQAEFRFELGGMQWKCRLDWLSLDAGFILDLKRTKDAWQDEYVPRLRTRGNFISANNYAQQLGLYREAVRQNHEKTLDAGIVALGMGDIPDISIRMWKRDYLWQLDDAVAEVKAIIPDIQAMRETDPKQLIRCERCDWCLRSRENFIFEHNDPERLRNNE